MSQIATGTLSDLAHLAVFLNYLLLVKSLMHEIVHNHSGEEKLFVLD